jgi:hypothetical protein
MARLVKHAWSIAYNGAGLKKQGHGFIVAATPDRIFHSPLFTQEGS